MATVDITVYDLGKNMKLYAYTATWCGPCRKIKPTLKNLMRDYEEIENTSVDKETFKKDINNFVPFFKLKKDDKDFKTLQSSDETELEKFINSGTMNISFDDL